FLLIATRPPCPVRRAIWTGTSSLSRTSKKPIARLVIVSLHYCMRITKRCDVGCHTFFAAATGRRHPRETAIPGPPKFPATASPIVPDRPAGPRAFAVAVHHGGSPPPVAAGRTIQPGP